MNPVPPNIRVEVIQRSLRCFVLGLLGLLPVFGLPLALAATYQYRRARMLAQGGWNPAHRYHFWGAVCARMSVTLHLLVVLVLGSFAVAHNGLPF